MPMIKIIMLVTSLTGGGAERVASELDLNFSMNIQRVIVTIRSELSYLTKNPPLSMYLDFKKNNLVDRLIKFIYSIIICSLKYRKLVKTYKPNISLSFLFFDNLINIITNNRRKDVKIIISVHSILSEGFKPILNKFTKHIIMILYNKADLIIAVSEGIRMDLIQKFNINPKKVKVIYNPIDMNKIHNLAKKKVNDEWFNDKLPIIINMGRLDKQKGQWHLIRSFSKVRKKRKCKLVICGDGQLKSYLKQLVSELDLINDVKFLGWQNNPFKYISKSSIFVFPSIREAFPLSLIEAMACGCPVIATDCKYGPSEILVDGKYGILIPPMDGIFYKASDTLTSTEECLTSNIIELLEDHKLRKRNSKLAKRRAKYFDKKTINDYENMMEQIVMGE